MAVSAWKIMVSLNAINMTGPAFQGLINSTREAHDSTAKMNAAVGMVRSTAALAFAEVSRLALEGFGAAAQSAGDLQLKLQLMSQTIGPVKDLGKVMKDLYKAQIDLSSGPNRTLFDMGTIADIQQSLIKTGNDPRMFLRQDKSGNSVLQQISYMAEMENLATHGEIMPETTAKNIGGFLQAYGIGRVKNLNDPAEVQAAIERAMKVADMFSKVSSVTPYTSAALRTSETYFGTLARRIGIKPEDMIMMGGYLSQMGQNASTAATGLANLFINAGATTSSSSAATPLPEAIKAKIRLGFLGHVNVDQARSMWQEQNKQMIALGLGGVNLEDMTTKQLNNLALQNAYRSMPSTLIEVMEHGYSSGGHKYEGFQAFAHFIDDQRTRYEHLFGKDAGDQRFMNDIRTALNIRGMREANAIDAGSVQSYVKHVMAQESISNRIKGLRENTLAGAEKSVGNSFKTLLIQLGGVGPDGKPIAGGPLDVMMKFFHGVNQIMIKINAWGSVHPGAIAKIGTMIGIVGALAALGSVILAITGMFALFGAVTGGMGLGAVGEALLGTGLMKGGGSLLRGMGKTMFNPFADSEGMRWLFGDDALRVGGKFVRGPRGMFGSRGFSARLAARRAGGWFGDVWEGAKSLVGDRAGFAWDWFAGHGQLRDATGRFIKGGAPRGMFGGAIDSNLSRFTKPFASVFGKLGEVIAKVLPFMGRFVPVLFEVGLRFMGIIGWVTLAIDALKFFADHPKDIGHWIAEIIIFFRDRLIPGTLDLIGKLAKGIWDYIADLLRRLWEVITHPWEIRDWYNKVAKQVQADMAADDKARAKARAGKGGGHGGHGKGGHTVAYSPTVNVHVHGGDAKKTTKAVVAALDEHLRRAARNGFGTNVPGTPHAMTGLA